MRYIAFLRGINVGGKNIIKMDSLKKSFESIGFKNVKTFIQSGNVLFDSNANNLNTLTMKIEKSLLKEYGSDIKVMLRTFDEVVNLVKKNPFEGIKPGKKIKLYVCFLSGKPKLHLMYPLVSEKDAVEVIRIEKCDAFIISRELKSGRFGFPNNFIEKEMEIFSTARNWNTVCKIIERNNK